MGFTQKWLCAIDPNIWSSDSLILNIKGKNNEAYLLRFFDRDNFDDALVFPELILKGSLYLNIELHEDNIGNITAHQHHTLPPHNGIVQEEDDEHDEIDDIEWHIPKKRPPGEVKHLPGKQRTHSDHK